MASGRSIRRRSPSSTRRLRHSAEEIARAQRIVDAYARADVEQGVGALVIDDEMVDAATLRVEEKRLAIARRAGLLS